MTTNLCIPDSRCKMQDAKDGVGCSPSKAQLSSAQSSAQTNKAQYKTQYILLSPVSSHAKCQMPNAKFDRSLPLHRAQGYI